MEKEPQPESLTTVTIKPDYPPSEVYSSEPPPAYHRGQSSAVQVARIIAITVVVVSVVLGSFILASAYVTATASCRQLEQELELLSEAADRFQSLPQPESLVQEESAHMQKSSEPPSSSTTEHIKKSHQSEMESNSLDASDESGSSNDDNEDDERPPVQIKLPLELNFDELAGALIDRNQRSRMNCVVEKKRAEEVVDHQPKTVRLPFGINMTTDPRYEHLSGERMAIFCESGNIQRHGPAARRPPIAPAYQQDDNNLDDDQETIMIQPIIPIPQTPFHTHMAQQQQPQRPYPPLPLYRQQPQNSLPPTAILHHIAQQIIAQKIQEAQQEAAAAQQPVAHVIHIEQQQPHQQQQHRYAMPEAIVPQRISAPEEVLSQLNRLPNAAGMIVAVSEQESDGDGQTEEGRNKEEGVVLQEATDRQGYGRALPVQIPVHMVQQEQEQDDTQASASEEPRPHYVQPRSIRSVDALLPESTKRVKRCSCNCAC